MDELVFDYMAEYEKYMTPESRETLHHSELYQQYRAEKASLSDQLAARFATKQALTDPVLFSQVQEFELLGKRVLQYMQELDPYGVEE